MKPLKLYLETSVWNFYYADDAPEKKVVTHQFYENLSANEFEIYISQVVLAEFADASVDKQKLLEILVNQYQPINLPDSKEARELAMSYLSNEVLPKKSNVDALHIAFATVYNMDAIVSWNMRHIANLRRQKAVQAINLLNGYSTPLQLISPLEVIYGT